MHFISPNPSLTLLFRKASSFGLSVLLLFSAWGFSARVVRAQLRAQVTDAESLGTTDPPPPGGTQAFNPVNSLEDFLNLGNLGDSTPPPPGGTRGNICALSPGMFGTDLSWSDRPIFVWHGRAMQLYVQEYQPSRDESDEERIWTLDLSANPDFSDGLTHIVPYTGEPLTPGILYEWVLVDGEDEDAYIFEVIGGEERSEVDQSLAGIATEELSSESLAYEQAKVFFESNLWSDALKVLYERNLLTEAFVLDACGLEPETVEPETAE